MMDTHASTNLSLCTIQVTGVPSEPTNGISDVSAAPNRGIRAVDIAQSILPALYITQYIIRYKQRWPHRGWLSQLTNMWENFDITP
jgi:hypothetical protein